MVPVRVEPETTPRHAVMVKVAKDTGPDPAKVTTPEASTLPETGTENTPTPNCPVKVEPVWEGVRLCGPPLPTPAQAPEGTFSEQERTW
jgi:hypothetical protein